MPITIADEHLRCSPNLFWCVEPALRAGSTHQNKCFARPRAHPMREGEDSENQTRSDNVSGLHAESRSGGSLN